MKLLSLTLQLKNNTHKLKVWLKNGQQTKQIFPNQLTCLPKEGLSIEKQ